MIIKLGCYVIQSTKPSEGSPQPANRITKQHRFIFLSRDVTSIKFDQYLPVVLTSLNVASTIFQKLVFFKCDIIIEVWRHGGGAWHSTLFQTTASNVNCWAEVASGYLHIWAWPIMWSKSSGEQYAWFFLISNSHRTFIAKHILPRFRAVFSFA